MKYAIVDDEEVFKPITLQMTFTSIQELQEFQIRMHLYGTDLAKVRPDSTKRAGITSGGQTNSKLAGICDFRNTIAGMLGKNSVVY